MTKLSKLALMLATASTVAVCATAASAAGTITSAGYTAGINDQGELFNSNPYIGLQNPAGSDYISPGTPRDSWGVAVVGGGAAHADEFQFGTNVGASTYTQLTASSAMTSTDSGIGVQVNQTFTFFAPNIVSIQEVVTNNTGVAADILFGRDVDFDVDPTAFNENTTGPLGANASVIQASYYGFENPDPNVPFSFDCTLSCNVTGDLGAGIHLDLGVIGAGESSTFAFYYGINAPGQTLNQLFAQAQGEGLTYLIGTQSSENGQYPNLGAGSAILGVSDLGTIAHSGTPEPATWGLMLMGFGGLGALLRRRRSAMALAA